MQIPDTPELPRDDALAQLMLRNDLVPIDYIKSFDEAHFAIGFAFEHGKSFYFADGVKWELGSSFITTIGVGWEGQKGTPLVEECEVNIEAWDKFSITDRKGNVL